MNALTIGISIYVEATGKTYHTLDDWGYALGNNNYISDPEQETAYVNVPYRDGLIDVSEALTGRPIFKKRTLSFELGGIHPRLNWDSVVSSLRNNIHGKICRLTLDNDKSYYWRGRVYVQDFDRSRELGTFKLNVPECEPYKYDITASNEEWLWDPFNFETGVITTIPMLEVNGIETVTIPSGHMLVSPQFEVSDVVSLTVSDGTVTKTLQNGLQRFPSIRVGGSEDVTLTFTGQGNVQIIYRGGSL